jgi:RNA polymerase sigma factor (sigma-70 family)
MPNRLLDCVRHAALLRNGGGLSDGQLLALFVKGRDGDAFAALVSRHGPMVLGVCRRLLANPEDAEDAFQATFLVLARKAGSVSTPDALAGWLYRVAYRAALEVRAYNARRRSREQPMEDLPHPEVASEDDHRELLAFLDRELDRLPDKYRLPVVLCELEGRGRKEVARLLGVPEGTLSWRLAQARKLLAKRLSRHGVAISAGALTAALAPGAASAQLRSSTVKVALAAGAVPADVLAVVEGVVKVMLLSKLKITVCAAALMLLVGVGASGLTYRAAAQQPNGADFPSPPPGALQPKQAESVSSPREPARGGPQADELEALRLEVEALRKELRATKERVRALEEERGAQKLRGPGQPRGFSTTTDNPLSGAQGR